MGTLLIPSRNDSCTLEFSLLVIKGDNISRPRIIPGKTTNRGLLNLTIAQAPSEIRAARAINLRIKFLSILWLLRLTDATHVYFFHHSL
jgi:hypothetical protein